MDRTCSIFLALVCFLFCLDGSFESPPSLSTTAILLRARMVCSSMSLTSHYVLDTSWRGGMKSAWDVSLLRRDGYGASICSCGLSLGDGCAKKHRPTFQSHFTFQPGFGCLNLK